jgi:hypothetical protein
VTINGDEVLAYYFPTMPEEGIIAWQLHGGIKGITAPEEVIFKDIHFRELNTDQVRVQRPAEKKLVRHHFLDSSNWQGLKQFWTMHDGTIKGATGLEHPTHSVRSCHNQPDAAMGGAGW